MARRKQRRSKFADDAEDPLAFWVERRRVEHLASESAPSEPVGLAIWEGTDPADAAAMVQAALQRGSKFTNS